MDVPVKVTVFWMIHRVVCQNFIDIFEESFNSTKHFFFELIDYYYVVCGGEPSGSITSTYFSTGHGPVSFSRRILLLAISYILRPDSG
jgi:hypothetical protein